jgi:hypothetical protein
MLSLLDVLPRSEKVPVGDGQELTVFGISTEDGGRILQRFPNAFHQMASSGGNIAGWDPALLGAMLAASQRNGSEHSMLGNDVAESRGRSLGMGVQLKLVQAIGRCTFPDGLGPFLEELASMSSGAQQVLQVVVQVASKAQAMTSPPRPKPSAPPATQPSGS